VCRTTDAQQFIGKTTFKRFLVSFSFAEAVDFSALALMISLHNNVFEILEPSDRQNSRCLVL